MRVNLKENPNILAKNPNEFRKISAVASCKEKTFLDTNEYENSVRTAKSIVKKLAFTVR